MAAAIAVATTPPMTAATMLVTFWIANWMANSSLRCSGSECSVRYGETTTWNVWLPIDHSAADRMITGSASLASSAAERDDARAEARDERRPPPEPVRRRGGREGDQAAGERRERRRRARSSRSRSPAPRRYRLKSIHHRLIAAPGDEARDEDQPRVTVEAPERTDGRSVRADRRWSRLGEDVAEVVEIPRPVALVVVARARVEARLVPSVVARADPRAAGPTARPSRSRG